MNKKNRALLIKILIPILIIGGVFGVEKFLSRKSQGASQDAVVVCEGNESLPQEDGKPLEIISKKSYGNIEGISNFIGFDGKEEAVIGIGISKEELNNKYASIGKDITEKKRDEISKDISGQLYSLNLSSLEKKPLNIETMNVLVKDTNCNMGRLIYGNVSMGDHIYNLKNGTINKFRPIGRKIPPVLVEWSKDGNCRMCYDGRSELEIYNMKDNTAKYIKIKRENLSVETEFFANFYSEDGKVIYFRGKESKGEKLIRQGIFKIHADTGEIEDVLLLPYVDKKSIKEGSASSYIESSFYVLNGGKRIILNATINKKTGMYMYNVWNKKIYCVLPDIRTGEYDGFSISPDETKIIYFFEKGGGNYDVYAAKINENNLTSKICIYKDVKLLGWGGFNRIQWSEDSKKILFFNIKDQMDIKDGESRGIRYNSESEINTVTFK